jgi:hypothetical protein
MMKKVLVKLWNATPWGRAARWRAAMMKLVEIYNTELYRLRNDVDELKRLARVSLDAQRVKTDPDFSELNSRGQNPPRA